MVKNIHLLPWLLAAILLTNNGLAIASIAINSSYVEARANDLAAGFGGASQTFTGTTIPSFSSLDTVHGGSSSLNDISWSTSGGQTILSVVMDHHRTGAGVSFPSAASLNPEPNDPIDERITFTVDVPTPYLLSGYYELQGTGNSGMFAGLRDADTTQSFFYESRSAVSANKVYTLGELGGGSTGSLSGILPAGTYDWLFGAHISGNQDSGADGDGYFTLTLGPQTDPGAVPEATSFLIWGLLGLSFAAGGWKPRTRR